MIDVVHGPGTHTNSSLPIIAIPERYPGSCRYLGDHRVCARQIARFRDKRELYLRYAQRPVLERT